MENKYYLPKNHEVKGYYDVFIFKNNVANFTSLKDAQEYCEWKNQKGIDIYVKAEVLRYLEDLRMQVHCIEKEKGFSDERIKSTDFANAIEIIKSWREAEE